MSRLTPNQWTVLEALQGGARWKRSFQTVLSLVDDLIARGLIEPCRPHMGRGRNMVRLTEAGCHLLDLDPASVPKFAETQGSIAAPTEAKHNRTEQASRLLAEIDAWCTATATLEGRIGHVLFLHPGFVGLLRKRLTVTPEKESAVKAFLSHNPAGWSGPLPLTHANGTKPLRSSRLRLCSGPAPTTTRTDGDATTARLASREPCSFCGVRSDVGCKHSAVAA